MLKKTSFPCVRVGSICCNLKYIGPRNVTKEGCLFAQFFCFHFHKLTNVPSTQEAIRPHVSDKRVLLKVAFKEPLGRATIYFRQFIFSEGSQQLLLLCQIKPLVLITSLKTFFLTHSRQDGRFLSNLIFNSDMQLLITKPLTFFKFF